MTPEQIDVAKELIQLLKDSGILKEVANTGGMSTHVTYILVLTVGSIGVFVGKVVNFHKESLQYHKEILSSLKSIIQRLSRGKNDH